MFFILCIGLIAGAVVGAALYAWWRRVGADETMRIPSKWPLTSRVLLTNEEHRVLNWLIPAFHDHLVMIKVPVLRFTIPVSKDKNGGGARWQEMLGGVYCTFTVCTSDGNVVGCVDVPGKRGLNKTNREVKESLLDDCRIAYTVVHSVKLPKVSAMRAAFLGEMEANDPKDAQVTLGGDSSFRTDLDSFTTQKRRAAKEAALLELNRNDALKPIPLSKAVGFNPDGSGAFGTGAFDASASGRFRTQWDDSFVLADDSRPAKLKEL